MKRRQLFEALTAALLAVLMVGNGLALAAPPEGKGGGGGGDDDGGGGIVTVVPPIQYHIKTFDLPADYSGGSIHLYQMTSSGHVVGNYPDVAGVQQPCIYDPAIDPDAAINLNDLGIVGVPVGWRISHATDMNDLGYVVGVLQNLTDPKLRRGFLLDYAALTLSTLPDEPAYYSYSRRINDAMDILGIHEPGDGSIDLYIYNPTTDTSLNPLGLSLWNNVTNELSNPVPGAPSVVAGRLADGSYFRLAIGGSMEALSLTSKSFINDISPFGEICGYYNMKPQGRNDEFVAFRYGSQLETFPDFGSATAITAHGDLTMGASGGLYLYHEGTGHIALDDVLAGSEADVAYWSSSTNKGILDMTERGAINADVPDYPGMHGVLSLSSGGYRGFLLTPVPAP